MADFFLPLLLSACVGTSAPYNPVCQKALEATYIQTGMAAKSKQAQEGTVDFGKKKTKEKLGKAEVVVEYTVIAALAVKKKKAEFTLHNFGPCNTVSVEAMPNSYGIKFGWAW